MTQREKPRRDSVDTKIVNTGPDISDLEEGLRIDPDGLDDACVAQPELFYRVAKELALSISRRDQQKQYLEETEAEVGLKTRHDAEVAEEKVTEGQIKSEVAAHPKVRAANSDLLRYQRRVAELTALKEAFSQRSYVLKDLVALYLANYYESAGEGGASKVKEVHAGRAKEEASRRRRERN